MSIVVEIKWGNNIYKDVSIDFNEDPSDFKARLFSLTNVPPDRQKLMLKGGVLKDTWAPFKNSIKTGQKLMLTGTADAVISGPTKETIFLEDLPVEEQSAALFPPGLKNLGNTCYMNSSIQCLHSIEELKEPLGKYIKLGQNYSSEANMIASARDLWRQIGDARSSVAPNELWQQLRTNHVRFDEQVRPGVYQQHDAEEFLSIMVQSFKAILGSTGSKVMDSLFDIEMEESFTNVEDKTDVIKRKSVESKLICSIDDKIAHTTDSLDRLFGMGASADSKEVLEVFSQKANKNIQGTKEIKMNKVPTYLTLQYSRFFIKRKEGEVISVKITKPVDIPMSLDVYKFCTPSLQSTLKRESTDTKKAVVENKDEIMEVEENKGEKTPTGVYDLYAVLTHQGRSLQGGHYVAFVRQSSDENDWLCFDDEKVSPKKANDVKNLSGMGGADGHIAYLCFYRARLA